MGMVAYHSPVRNPYLYDHPYRFYSEKDDIKGIKLSVQKDPDAEGEVSNFEH